MGLRTIGLFSLLAIGVLAVPLYGETPKSRKVYRIGYLGARSATPNEIAFRQGLRDLGYVEGQNVVIEDRFAGLTERPLGQLAAQLAAELVQLKVDVIVTSPAPAVIRAAQRATHTTPIVMPYTVVNPVEAGFVRTMAKPGGNITGLTNLESELYAKRLGLLKEAFPQISRVVVLWGLSPPKRELKAVLAAGQALGLQIRPLALATPRLSSLEDALSAISRERPDGLVVSPSGFIRRHRTPIIAFTAMRRLPTMYSRSYFVEAGGLMSYGANRVHLYRRAATYVDKILKGAKPGDLPIEQPTKFDLVINLKTAKALGLTIPSSVLYRADKVIK